MKEFYKILSVSLFLAFASCADSSNNSQNGESDGKGILGFFSSDETDGITYQSMLDPKENAFTVDAPKNWNSKIGLERVSSATRQCGVFTSPDNKTRVFFGDPSIPNFILPEPSIGMYENGPFDSPTSQVKQFVSADNFMSDYAKMAYGRNPDFKIISVQPNEELRSIYDTEFRKFTNEAKVSASNVRFEFGQGNEKITGEIQGVTFLIGSAWNVEVRGFTTTPENVKVAQKVLETIVKSCKTTPEWREKENQAFAMRMENERNNNNMIMNQMQSSHNQRMNDMNNNFNAHQQRMGNLQQSYDAHNQTYNQGQAYQDDQHRRFIDNVRGEQQVSNGNNQAKVEAGYNHYYINQSNNSYIGTNSQLESTPNDYQEYQIDN